MKVRLDGMETTSTITSYHSVRPTTDTHYTIPVPRRNGGGGANAKIEDQRLVDPNGVRWRRSKFILRGRNFSLIGEEREWGSENLKFGGT